MEVQCKYSTHKETFRWVLNVYTCTVTGVLNPSLEKEIKSFNGRHGDGNTNKDVKWLLFFCQPIGFFPRNLHKVFPNLKYLTISCCGVENISREDLKGLEDIEYLCLIGNKLNTLPDDLFADMKKLRFVFIHDNHLERMTSKLLKPIERILEVAEFQNSAENAGFSELFDVKKETNNDLAKFMRAIDSKCLPPGSQSERMLGEFAKLKASGDLTDFTIRVQGDEYKIHKVVLAAQSSVFRRMFTDAVEEVTSKTFNRIKSLNDGVFEKFLDYFYTGKVDAGSRATEMFELASEFDVPEVKIICTARILANLKESNAVEVFNLGHLHESEQFRRQSFEIILKMYPELDDTFENKLDEVNNFVSLKSQIDALLKKK